MQKININNYDTVILDLDFTVWKGCKPHFWAKSLHFPIYKNKEKIIDSNGDYISLYRGVKSFLKYLKKQNKNIGFITRGGLLNTQTDDQPCVICLKTFDIYQYFNYNQHILYKTDLKSRVFCPFKKTIFIDDNPIDLNDIKINYPDVTVLDRNLFKKWTDLL